MRGYVPRLLQTSEFKINPDCPNSSIRNLKSKYEQVHSHIEVEQIKEEFAKHVACFWKRYEVSEEVHHVAYNKEHRFVENCQIVKQGRLHRLPHNYVSE